MFQVLVVEDDQELNRTVCAYLNQNGYQALGCLNANEAYVLRVLSDDGLPTEAVCVTARGEKHCWNPGDDMLGGDFIRWSATKGLK